MNNHAIVIIQGKDHPLKTETRMIRSRPQMLIRLVLLALWLELSLLGATFNGILLPSFQPLTLTLLAGGVAAWLIWHVRSGRPWHVTALDGVMLGWWLVFALSLAANGDTWRRSAEALWYMGLYTLVYLILSDLIAQGLPRRTLSFVVLIAGGLHVVIGALQTITLLQTGGFDTLRRPVGLIGNPNAYGGLLLVLLPLALSEALTAQRTLVRGLWLLYAGAAAALLFFSASRGAWIGAAVGLLVYALLLMRHYNLTSWAAVRATWAGQSRRMRALLVVGGAVGLIGAAGAGLFLVRSLSDQGRSAELRTYLWVAAWDAFKEKPLTGWGLFTYGRQLDRFSSIPPQQSHSHAHNVFFTMSAELGIPGLVILAASVAVTLWQMGRVWHVLDRERVLWGGQAAALIGLGLHHLLDTPAMMPVIALLVIIMLAGCSTLPAPPLRSARWRPVFLGGLVAVSVSLIGLGVWSASVYSTYVSALGIEDIRAAAQALDAVVAQDPRQAAYLLERAMLYGMAANQEASLLPRAIDAFYASLAVEPTNSEAWVNLSALYWQAGDTAQAQSAITEALRLAPAAPFAVLQNIYAGDSVTLATIPPLRSPYAINRARNEYLRDVLEPEYLPQVLRLVGQE